MTHYTRRNIVKGGLAASGSVLVAKPAMAFLNGKLEPAPPIQDPRLKQLIKTAIDSAITAGAGYADARLTFTKTFSTAQNTRFFASDPGEEMGFGVRALISGFWGFASSTTWNTEEAGRLGRAAVAHAAANRLGQSRDIDLAPILNGPGGDWIMPVKDDPFEMAYEEISDFAMGLALFGRGLEGDMRVNSNCRFWRQDKAFGNSLDCFNTQRLYRTGGEIELQGMIDRVAVAGKLDTFSNAGLGFEYFRDQPLREDLEKLHAELVQEIKLPVKPLDVGRYPVLINAYGMAEMLMGSIGVATQVDISMGYEANAGGASYIVEPSEMLGDFKIGSSLVNVTASRSEAGSVGRVKWDDEGVEPIDFTLVKDGVLVNMQTNREGAGWIKSHYKKNHQQFSSFGCASAPDATRPPLVHSADLTLQPSTRNSYDLDSLRAEIEDGIEYGGTHTTMDFQQITGYTDGKAFEIKKGKRTARLANAAMIFRAPEFWDNIIHLGGANTVRRLGTYSGKGEPKQIGWYSVSAPPAVIKEMTFIDKLRKV